MAKKKPEQKTIPIENVDVVRQTIVWHAREALKLQKQLEPHKTPRGTIGGTNEEGDAIFMIFKGSVEDLIKVNEFIKGLDSEK